MLGICVRIGGKGERGKGNTFGPRRLFIVLVFLLVAYEAEGEGLPCQDMIVSVCEYSRVR